ncbi:MAG: OmpH family outer membrane protein [Bacteroidetes bacterium]|nr:OmpH family outer membrane protein [Bacteroidota bacterium]
MKKIFLIFILSFLANTYTQAQKFGYVDTEYILGQLPEYKSAQKQLDELAAMWQKELEDKMADVDRLYREYQDEKVLLTDDLKKKREDQIANKEKAMRDYQKQKFGSEGDLFKKRQELVKPIQDKVFEAIQKVARKSGLDFIFDKGGDMIMLYSNSKFDKSDEVLEELGITPVKDKSSEKKDDKAPVKPGALPPKK